MITAVDTSVLIDIVCADARWGPASRAALGDAGDEGILLACDAVWAEMAATFAARAPFEAAMASLGVRFDALDAAAAQLAGQAQRLYRSRGGRRTRALPDFLVGAHAQLKADRLLTRDRGFYRAYFRKLELMDPSRG